MAKSWIEIEEQVRRIICEQLGCDPKTVTLKASFVDDLGGDSLDLVEIIMSLEEEFGAEIADEDAEKIMNVEAIIDYIATRFSEADRKDLVDSRVIAFRIREDGRIQVGMQKTDGNWVFADGTSLLPSGVYLTVFNKWAEILKELEELVNSPHVKEADLQHFFEQYPDLLKGDEYDRIIPQARIVPEIDQTRTWRADFVLHPFDQNNFCKILELKPPEVPTFRKASHGHPLFYAELKAAIDQLRDYGEAFHSTVTREKFYETYRTSVFKPDLQLIIGRKWDLIHMQHLLDIQRRSQLVIVDWDTLLEKMKRSFT